GWAQACIKWSSVTRSRRRASWAIASASGGDMLPPDWGGGTTPSPYLPARPPSTVEFPAPRPARTRSLHGRSKSSTFVCEENLALIFGLGYDFSDTYLRIGTRPTRRPRPPLPGGPYASSSN